jgi:hypothetical protein
MNGPSEQIQAARMVLREVCTLLAEHGDDAVLVGGWVPEVLFPTARPAHIGSIDVDMALRLQRAAHEAVVTVLSERGFRPGPNPYQFLKDVRVADGRTITVRLDLLTSARHHAAEFGDRAVRGAPEPVHGADIAFRDNSVVPIGPASNVQIRVAGIVAFLVMKGIALVDRPERRAKDAYDIHFCLEQYPDGIAGLVEEFVPWLEDELVREGLAKMGSKFRSEEDEGPRMVADVEEVFGESRAMRKLAVYTRVDEFLAAVRAARPPDGGGQ